MANGLLKHRGYWHWSAGAQLARLPMAMAPLAFTAATSALLGSATAGGVLVAAMVIAELVCAVPVGRVLDRVGVTRGARVLLLARGLAYLGLLGALMAALPLPALIAIAALPGALGAGVLGGFRALLSGIVGTAQLTRAVAVNAFATDIVIVAGPVLVAGLTALWWSAPLLAMACCSLAAIAMVPRVRPVEVATAAGPGRMEPALLSWCVAAFALGHLCSGIEVAALPLAERLGAGPGGASIVVTVFCVASMIGALVYARADPDGSTRLAATMLAVMAAGGAAIALGPGWMWVLAGLVAAGACIAPLMTIYSIKAEHVMPAHRRAEGFAILNAAQGLGFAAGSVSLSVMPLPAVGLAASVSAVLAATVLFTLSQRPAGLPVPTGDVRAS